MSRITINSNLASLNVQRRLSLTSGDLRSTFEKLSSGLRITRSSDDAAGLAIAAKLNTDSRVYAQGIRNVNDGLSCLNIAEGALSELLNITLRQQELAEQASNGTYSDAQRAALDKEARALTDEYNRIVQVAEFNNRPLFATSWESLMIEAGEGADGTLSFNLGDKISSTIEPGSYFQFSSGGTMYNVWFAVDGQGSAPAVSGSKIRIDLSSESRVEVTDLTLPDTSAIGGTWFFISSGDQYDYVWFDSGGDGDPMVGNKGIRVDVSGLSTADEVAGATLAALNNTGEYSAESRGGATIRVSTLVPGPVLDIWDDTSGTIVNLVQDGASQKITAPQIAQEVVKMLTAYSINAVLEDSTTIKITNSTTGNYTDAQNIDSNIIVASVVDGTGLATIKSVGRPQDPKLVDLNNDGNLDLMTAGLASGVSVSMGNGDGTFGAAANYVSTSYTWKTSAADLNGDGFLDMIATDWLGAKMRVLLNNGDGTFGAAAQYSTTLGGAFGIATGDFNADGHIDIAITNNQAASALNIFINKGDGSGTFNNPTAIAGPANGQRGIVARDFTGDGILDLASSGGTSGQVTIWQGNGSGSFAAIHTYSGSTLGYSIAAGDLNGDGASDIIINTAAGITVRINNGSGDFSSSADYAMSGYATTTADINGDGHLDLCTTDNLTKVYLRLNDGNGTFGAQTSYSMGTKTTGVAAADVNGDGFLDLVVSDEDSNSVKLRLNNGDATFIDPRGDQKEVSYISFGDGRGRPDIGHVDLSTLSGALDAINTLAGRLVSIENERGSLGANQSRLATAVGVLSASRENFDNAASRITDVDVAVETANMVRLNILREIGSAVLSQANQTPQIALMLLENS